MSKAKKLAGRARKEAREEQQGKNVVKYIFGALIAAAVIFAGYICVLMG